jgi:hypothetical protein
MNFIYQKKEVQKDDGYFLVLQQGTMDGFFVQRKITKVNSVQSRSPSLHLLLSPQAIDTYVHMHASAISVVVVILVGRSGSPLMQLLTLGVCRSTAYSTTCSIRRNSCTMDADGRWYYTPTKGRKGT